MEFIARELVTCNSEVIMVIFALLALVAALGISVIPVYLLRRKEYARAQEYFVASEHTPPGVVQNSSIAYSLQIATVGQFFSWGAGGDFWPAIVFSAMFGTSLYFIYKLRRPMVAFMSEALGRDRSITVPGFIARQHGNDARVQLFAGTLSVFAFTGLITSTAIGVASLVKPILPGGLNGTFPIASGLLGLMMLYTIPAGNSGAMRSAQAQLGILYLGLTGSTLIVLYMLISSAGRLPPHGTFAVTVLAACCAVVLIHRRSRYIDTSPIGRPLSGSGADMDPLGARLFRRFSRVVNEVIAVLAATTLAIALIELYAEGFPAVITGSVATLQAETRTSVAGVLVLVLLPIFYPIVDTTNWLRIAALEADPHWAHMDVVRTPEAFARVLGMYAGASALLWLLICMFGTIAVLATGMPVDADLVQSFVARLGSQQNDVADAALWLLLVSVVAMAVLTMSAMFSATLATIRYDIIPAVWPGRTSGPAQPSDRAVADKRAVIAGGGFCLAVFLVLLALNHDADLSFMSVRFLDFQFACLCLQLAFSPLVLGPMIGGNSAAVSPAWAIAVLAAGVAAGQGVIIGSLQPEHQAWLWSAIPCCLGSGLWLYVIALLWKKGTHASR